MDEFHNPRHLFAVFGVCFLLLIAGCIGGGSQSDSVGPDETEAQAGGLLDDPPTQNPWEADNITIQIVDQPDQRDYAPLINESIEYWNENISALGWEGQFVYDSTTENPDVPVRIVDQVDQCGTEHTNSTYELMGCAPVYNQTGEAIDRGFEPVRVVGGLNDSSTVDVSTHEFGHSLGLTHEDQDSWPVMNRTIGVASVQQPNATERANPFETETIRVYYNESENSLNDYTIGELDDVWDYFNSGESEIVPSNVTFERTDNESSANIELQIVDEADAGVSIANWYGYDPDADGAAETYDIATIQVQADVNQDHVAWHVGSWTTFLFSTQEEGALPDELTSRDPDTRGRWPS
jgi:hypothetical protein